MVEFMYKGDYEHKTHGEDDQTMDPNLDTILTMHGAVFGLACKYGVDALKASAVEKFDGIFEGKSSASVVDALRAAYSVAELPREGSMLQLLFNDPLEDIPSMDSALQDLLDENHEFASAFAAMLLKTLNFDKFERLQYLRFVGTVLENWAWYCSVCRKYNVNKVVVDEGRGTVKVVCRNRDSVQCLEGSMASLSLFKPKTLA